MSRPIKNEGISFEALRGQIDGGQIASLYLLIGEERRLHDEALKMLFDTIDPALRPFNAAVFTIGSDNGTGSKTTIAQALDAANQMPMMSARRIVIIRDFDKIKEDEQDQVFSYLKNPSPTTTVVFQAPSPDKRRKLTVSLLKSCTVTALDAFDDQRARGWAWDLVNELRCRIDADALRLLIGLTGPGLTRLANELEKLAAYADGGTIDRAAVEELVPRVREHTGWELWDAIGSGDRKRSLRLMNHLLEDSDPLPILGSIASYYRKLLIGKDLMDSGASTDEIKKATGQWSPSFFKGVRRAPREVFERGLERIAQVDNAIKNSEGTPRLQMQYLIAELTLPPATRKSI
jgi:DNA polymerase-3 subunit delta